MKLIHLLKLFFHDLIENKYKITIVFMKFFGLILFFSIIAYLYSIKNHEKETKNKYYDVYCERVDGKTVKYKSIGLPEILNNGIKIIDERNGQYLFLVNVSCQYYTNVEPNKIREILTNKE